MLLSLLGLLGAIALGCAWKIQSIQQETKSQEIIRQQQAKVAGTNRAYQMKLVALVQMGHSLPDGTTVNKLPHYSVKEASRIVKKYLEEKEGIRWWDGNQYMISNCTFDKDGYLETLAGRKVRKTYQYTDHWGIKVYHYNVDW